MANDFAFSSASQNTGRLPDHGRAPIRRENVAEKPTLELSPAAGEAVFETVVAAMWSNGELSTAEVDRGRAVARALGVKPSRGGSAFAAIAQGSLRFDEIAFSELDAREARLALAASEWATATTDEPSDRQLQFLRGLQLRLRLDDNDAAALRDLAMSASADKNTPLVAFGKIARRVLATERD